MSNLAVIQTLFPVLNTRTAQSLDGFSKNLYQKFFEVLVDESGYGVFRAANLAEYQEKNHPEPDMIICAPFPEIGNLAPGFVELEQIKNAFSGKPIIVWTNRNEKSWQKSLVEEHGVTEVYMGTLIDAPDDIADMMLKYLK